VDLANNTVEMSDLKCLDGALPKIKSYVAGAEVAERVAKGLPPIPEAA
jgi:hypothetical protein